MTLSALVRIRGHEIAAYSIADFKQTVSLKDRLTSFDEEIREILRSNNAQLS